MTGLVTGVGVFGTIGSVFILIERSGVGIGPDVGLPLLVGGTALGGLGAAASKFWVLTHPKKTLEQPSTLAKVAESVKNGVLGHGVSVSLGVGALAASDILHPNYALQTYHTFFGSYQQFQRVSRLTPENLMLLCAGSAIVGLCNAARTYWSRSQPAPKPAPALPAKDQKTEATNNKAATPSNDPKKVQLTTAQKIGASLAIGMFGGGTTFTLGMTGFTLLDAFVGIPPRSRFPFLMNVVHLSLLMGLVSYQNAYAAFSRGIIEVTPGQPGGGKAVEKAPPGPTLAERWNRMPKTKRRRIIAVSTLALAALGIFYMGPSKIAEKISNAAQGLSDLHQKLAYTTQTKTQTKQVREWIAGFTDQEEMKRLAALPLPVENSDVVAATCAEILNTCDIPEKEVSVHKKVYHKKSLKFGPDKNPTMKDVANKAQAVLNYAQELIKKEGTCGGGEDACSDISATWTLREPNWLYKQLGAESDCQIVFEGGDPEKRSPADCIRVI